MSDAKQIEDIQIIQIESLMHRLELANSRVLELEAAERRLNIEIEEINQRFRCAFDGAVAKSVFGQIYPSNNIYNFIKTTDIVQRRNLWIDFLMEIDLLNTKLSSIFPHDGCVDPMLILMRGSGGFGDMIYLSAIMKSFHDRFPGSKFVVLHEHPAAKTVFQSNPYVVDTISLSGHRHVRFLNGATSIDVFDLVVDVRYVVTYAAPPLSRMDTDFLRTAHTRSVRWQKYVRREWPYLNNLLASEARRHKMGKLDLAGYTSMLEVGSKSFGDIFPVVPLRSEVVHKLCDGPFVTVHTGSDPNMAGVGGMQTKNLSSDQWQKIVSICKENGYYTVQLGENNESLIEGVELDLRGVTTFEESALVLKHSHVHIDTEGGLVHLARAVGTRSVVAFGPTPSSFFGYDGNVNIDPSDCGDCWWTVPTWSKACPLNLTGPACMVSHSPETIASSALAVARETKRVTLVQNLSMETQDLQACMSFVGEYFAKNEMVRAAIVSSSASLHHELKSGLSHLFSFDHFVPAKSWHEVVWRGLSPIRPYTNLHVPGATNSLEWLVVDLAEMEHMRLPDMIAEAARLVVDGGAVTVFWPVGAKSLPFGEFESMIASLPGCRLSKNIERSSIGNDGVGSVSTFKVVQEASKPARTIKTTSNENNIGKVRSLISRIFRRR